MRLSGSNNMGEGSPVPYAARGGQNRVRREPAVAGSSNANSRGASNQSKSNSRSRAQEYAAKLAEQRKARGVSMGSANRVPPGQTRPAANAANSGNSRQNSQTRSNAGGSMRGSGTGFGNITQSTSNLRNSGS